MAASLWSLQFYCQLYGCHNKLIDTACSNTSKSPPHPITLGLYDVNERIVSLSQYLYYKRRSRFICVSRQWNWKSKFQSINFHFTSYLQSSRLKYSYIVKYFTPFYAGYFVKTVYLYVIMKRSSSRYLRTINKWLPLSTDSISSDEYDGMLVR
jgi:hypothetical protein